MINIIFPIIYCALILSVISIIVIIFQHIMKTKSLYVGKNIKCGGDMIINGRHIPVEKSKNIQDVCVVNGRFTITYTDGGKFVGDDDPAHDMYTKG